MRHIIFILTISLFVISCGQNDNKQKELELKEKELALKEKEIYLDSVQKSTKAEPVSPNTTAPISQPVKDIAEKEATIQSTGDRENFICP